MRIGMNGVNGVSDQERYARLHEADAAKKAEQVVKPEDSDGNPKIDYIDPKKDVSPEAKDMNHIM